MKKQLLFLLLFTLSFVGYSQFNKYYAFPDSNAWWSVTSYTSVDCNNIMGNENTNWDYYLSGDTVFNGHTYHKLRIAGGSKSGPCGDSWYDYDELVGFIREDSSKHIYYNLDGTGDTLLYDFNLDVGDTLPNTWNNNKIYVNRVDSVDSVMIGNTYRRKFVISSNNIPFCSLIEGIGSTMGLLEPIMYSTTSGSTLTCFKQNNKTLYPDTTASCNLFYLGVPGIYAPQPTVSLYPDPNNGVFTLEIKNYGPTYNSEIDIYSMLGEKVYSKFSGYSSQIPIHLSIYAAGIYLYRITTMNGKQLATGKFVIK